MAGLVPAIHAFNLRKDVDARHKAGHDEQSIIWPVLRTGPAGAEGKGVPSPVATPSTVIPAQAGIHKHDGGRKGGTVCASFSTVSGYGSRAPLRGPGMTAGVNGSPSLASLAGDDTYVRPLGVILPILWTGRSGGEGQLC